jgi:exopolysaccharide biosynthesis protein
MKHLFLSFTFVLLITSLATLSGCHTTDTPPEPIQDSTGTTDSTDTTVGNTFRSPVMNRIVKTTNLVQKVYDDTLFQVTKGVKETDIYYQSTQNRPIHLFILRVDLNNPQITLEAALLYNGSIFKRQTVLAMAKQEDHVNHRVVGAVNADFFHLKAPWGIVVKNGKVLKDTWDDPASRSFLAILKNGDALIGNRIDFNNRKGAIKGALGAEAMLVFNGSVQPVDNTKRAPRTGVGMTSDGIIYFVVVDGRAKNYSLGMTRAQLAEMLRACGADRAINLDGGGSSTFLIQKNGKFKLRNEPSDGSLRAVSNAWLIIKK